MNDSQDIMNGKFSSDKVANFTTISVSAMTIVYIIHTYIPLTL
jgi:hypothetical protein